MNQQSVVVGNHIPRDCQVEKLSEWEEKHSCFCWIETVMLPLSKR